MTDDDLERALAALPLEEPPADLRARIMAATVEQPALVVPGPFRISELIALLVVVVAIGALTLQILQVPDAGPRSGAVIAHALRSLGLFSFATYLWFAVGVSAVWALSSLPLMPAPVRTVYNR